ncbi:pirin family protein [Vulgatibacter incomptus]|uniref:Pirin n=1 Tax=Vulgatibacter incomptus TaxID=1391653 RepID=A0A0K1PH10_9BACT|nr:pirin family protein [Vulgatibacter incomptus]AKU92787.1 Pirin [Vulgatibacter incomptus]
MAKTGEGPGGARGQSMDEARQIRKVVKSRPTIEGAGVHLHRAIGLGPPELYDPFLLLDDFRSDRPDDYVKGFPWHPHRGMETITYVLRGEVAHGDSLGNRGVISPGDVQWMTAGSGIIHQEMPKGDESGAMYGFQLWANLPAADKMMEPRYRGIRAADIPEVTDSDGTRIKIIAGTARGVTGPVRDVVTGPEYLDVTVPPSTSFTHRTPRGHTVFAYVIEGKGLFCEQGDPFSYEAEGDKYFDVERDRCIGNDHLVLFGDGDSISVRAESEQVRFLLISGKPIGEPIAWYGPIVMNTQDELRTAYEELEKGTFIKTSPPA